MLRILRTNPDIAEASGLGDLLCERHERPHSSTAQERDKYASLHGGEMRERGSRVIRLTAAGLHGLRAVTRTPCCLLGVSTAVVACSHQGLLHLRHLTFVVRI